MLSFGLQLDLGRLLDDALDGDLNEVVELIQLLTYETFLVEIGRNDQPAGLLLKAGLDVLQVHAILSTKTILKMWNKKNP